MRKSRKLAILNKIIYEIQKIRIILLELLIYFGYMLVLEQILYYIKKYSN